MTTEYFLARIAGRDPNLRAADADRERVAERLRKGNAEGRLDMTEFQQRLERCYEAKTYGDLEELVRDLPRQTEDDARPSPVSWFRPWRWGLAGLAPVLIVLLVISAAAGHHHFSWLWIPLLFVFFRMFSWRRRRWSAAPRRGPGDWL
jgi:DUF1707 SHOCT-like domain